MATDALAFVANLSQLEEGVLADNLPANVTVTTGGSTPGLWTGSCTANVTTFDAIDDPGLTRPYKLGGSLTCPAPLMSIAGDPLTLTDFAFQSAAVYLD
ncbi:MAG: hypothetical protein B7733_07245 [Myxococcales bacterium FL481]|nr:MAG: hypothetical protein B7733_07245 [Myxococcales bacterium FL481]